MRVILDEHTERLLQECKRHITEVASSSSLTFAQKRDLIDNTEVTLTGLSQRFRWAGQMQEAHEVERRMDEMMRYSSRIMTEGVIEMHRRSMRFNMFYWIEMGWKALVKRFGRSRDAAE